MNKVTKWVTKEMEDYKMLLRAVPPLTLVFFVISVVFMNLFANKELLNFKYIALDCGFLLSWLSFLCMDMLTKRFGAKAAIKLSLFAIGINLFSCLLFYIVSVIGGNWGEYYTFNNPIANNAINNTIGGTGFVLFGSMVALAVASIVNAITNVGIGKLMKSNNFRAYAMRSYVSTMVGQFVDNMLFALIVSHTLFGWTLLQCVTCSFAGAIMELLSEVVFSPVGYKVSKGWEKHKIGQSYIDYRDGGIVNERA